MEGMPNGGRYAGLSSVFEDYSPKNVIEFCRVPFCHKYLHKI
jgi:hypothetical protein